MKFAERKSHAHGSTAADAVPVLPVVDKGSQSQIVG